MGEVGGVGGGGGVGGVGEVGGGGGGRGLGREARMREQIRDRQYFGAPPASVNSAEGDAKAAEEDGAELTVEEMESKEKELQTSWATEKLDKEQALI